MDAYERIKYTRKAGRPTALTYIEQIFDGFMEMHGDRGYGDDHALVGGIAWLGKRPVTVIGIEKGFDTNQRSYRHFGCVLPEGYRKALRLMKQAEKFHRPVICLVDTQGASCGSGAEQRGIGEAIAKNLAEMMTLKVPVISLIIGEGGSGGALALAVADRVWMLDHSYYSVVAPESCASILYKDPSRRSDAAEHLKPFPENLLEMNIIEKIIPEPEDFSQEKQMAAFLRNIEKELEKELKQLSKKKVEVLLAERYEKYRKIGRYEEITRCL